MPSDDHPLRECWSENETDSGRDDDQYQRREFRYDAPDGVHVSLTPGFVVAGRCAGSSAVHVGF